MARHERDLGLERAWRRHIERQCTSGLTIRDYCCDHDLAESAFYFWRRTIAERDRQASASAPPALTTPAFVPVTLIDDISTPASSPIDIYLRGGQRLRVRAGCDPQLLAAVLALLEGRSC